MRPGPDTKRARAASAYAGSLGETTYKTVLVSSPDGSAVPVEVCTSLNVATDPHLYQALLGGSLHVLDFGETTCDLAQSVVVHDPAHELFVLVLPACMRHEEMRLRAELLRALAAELVETPAYVREARVAFTGAGLEAQLDAMRSARAAGTQELADELEALRADFREKRTALEEERTELERERASLKERVLAAQDAQGSADGDRQALDALRMELEQERASILEERRSLDEQRERVEIEKHQLGDVAERLDRERARMEQIESQIMAERRSTEEARRALLEDRQQLERERLALEARRLNLAEQEHRIAQEGPAAQEPEEKTQVVSDDQFLEIVGDAEVEEVSEATQITTIDSAALVEVPRKYPEKGADAQVVEIDGQVVCLGLVEARRVGAITGAEPVLMVQYNELQGYALVSVLLATLDDTQQLIESVSWVLDPGAEGDRAILDALAQRSAVRFAFYDPRTRALLRTLDMERPLERNVSWALGRADRFLGNPRKKTGSFEAAVRAYRAPDYELLGSMRHNFTRDSFVEVKAASEAKLAAGIVGYWSRDNLIEHLIGNRSFPLAYFEEIQARTLNAALDWGLYLDASLRRFAMEHDVVPSQAALVRKLMANFGEAAVGLKANNDLDVFAQWDNWEALLGLAEELDVQPDPEIVELAQRCLEQARALEEEEYGEEEEYELEEISEEEVEEFELEEIEETGALPGPPAPPKPPAPKPARPPRPPVRTTSRAPKPPPVRTEQVDGQEVIARVSEATGVTYFLPDPELGGQVEEFGERDREELLEALEGARTRLEASQVAIERFGASVVEDVLIAAEEMTAGEVASLARFVEDHVDGLEDALIAALKTGGPSTTYITARALARAKYEAGIAPLIDALADPSRRGNHRALMSVLARFDAALVGPLRVALAEEEPDDMLIELLLVFDRRRGGTIEELVADQNQNVRQAARQARRRAKK